MDVGTISVSPVRPNRCCPKQQQSSDEKVRETGGEVLVVDLAQPDDEPHAVDERLGDQVPV